MNLCVQPKNFASQRKQTNTTFITYQKYFLKLFPLGREDVERDLCHTCFLQLYVLYFSFCCLWDTYLTKLRIQKQIKISLMNLSSFCGLIALCFWQSLSCFTRDSRQSYLVAIYSESSRINFIDTPSHISMDS